MRITDSSQLSSMSRLKSLKATQARGLTQYEVFNNILMIPILRATGQISNPKNPARTTPAGPPVESEDLQMLKHCIAEFYVFFGNENAFDETIKQVYNYIIV